MYDDRVIVVTTSNGFTALGKTFKSRTELDQHIERTVLRRERYAGRRLTAKELNTSLARQDDRDARQRIADDNWKVVVKDTEAPEDDNPFRKSGDKPQGQLHGRAFREALRADMESQWDQRTAEREKASQPMSARQIAAIEAAEALLERIRFSPEQPFSAVVRAEQLLAQAAGDLDHFRAMYAEITSQLRQQADDRQTAIDAEIERLKTDRDGLRDFDDDPTPATPATYLHDSPEDRARREDGYRLAWGPDRSKWPAEVRG